jgi:transaldolase
MKLFADTASLKEIAYCFSIGVDDGITTNPKIMEVSGDLSLGFESACKANLNAYPNVPVSLETDLQGIHVSELEHRVNEVKNVLLEQAYTISSWGDNVVVKIPVCSGGLEAVKELSKRGIKTNVTACMTAYQALIAADKGATYVSLFANRMVDSAILFLSGYKLKDISSNNEWKRVVAAGKDKHIDTAWAYTLDEISAVMGELDIMDSKTELIIGSIRSPNDIYKIAEAQPHIITIPTKIVEGLSDIKALKERKASSKLISIPDSLTHPMTTSTLEEFERAADSYRKK